jgi:vacuolar-type H+-ATPase subunit H
MATPGSTPSPRSVTECLDALEALLESGGSIFGRRARTDEARQLVAQLRALMSQGTARAQQVQTEAEAVLRRAQDEARRIVLEAQERARGGVDAEVVRGAELEAQEVRAEALREADDVRRQADLYALKVFERLDAEVSRVLSTIKRGKAILGDRNGAGPTAGRLDNEKMASV